MRGCLLIFIDLHHLPTGDAGPSSVAEQQHRQRPIFTDIDNPEL